MFESIGPRTKIIDRLVSFKFSDYYGKRELDGEAKELRVRDAPKSENTGCGIRSIHY